MTTAKNKLRNYGLYGEKETLLPDFMHCETVQYGGEKHQWLIEPHLHAHLHQVFLIEEGGVVFVFEDGRHTTNSGSIITIPENTLHGLEISKDIKGWVLTLSTSFIETLFKQEPDILTQLGTTWILTGLQQHPLFGVAQQMLYGFHEEMRDEMPKKPLMLQGYLSLLLCSVYRLSMEQSSQAVEADNRYLKYAKAFQRSVKQTCNPKKTVNEYARELHITPVHLNRACQATLNKSALQVVHAYFYQEAIKYLKHTEYSISEIAYRLNFDDPAYFSRFFSKIAGMSPKQFRGSH